MVLISSLVVLEILLPFSLFCWYVKYWKPLIFGKGDFTKSWIHVCKLEFWVPSSVPHENNKWSGSRPWMPFGCNTPPLKKRKETVFYTTLRFFVWIINDIYKTLGYSVEHWLLYYILLVLLCLELILSSPF